MISIVYEGRTLYRTEKNKSRKAAGHNEIPPKVWKIRKFDGILLKLCNAVYKQNNIKMDKRLHPAFLGEKGNLGSLKTTKA